MRQAKYSYELERAYYAERWPERSLPFLHLEPYLRSWLDPERVFSGKRILDLGAGECTYTRLIAERFAPRYVVASDLFSLRMQPAARANRNPKLSFVSADAFNLPFLDGSFDVVFSSLFLCQIPGTDRIVKEVRRVLADDGSYVGIEPNPSNPVVLLRFLGNRHSGNQFLLTERHLSAFTRADFDVSVRYFYARWPWLRWRFGATCMGILASRARVSGQG